MKQLIVLHGYLFSYRNSGLGPHNAAMIGAVIKILKKHGAMPVVALGGLVPGQEERGLISQSIKKALLEINNQLTVDIVIGGYLTTTDEAINAIKYSEQHSVARLYLPLLWSHLPRTLWHYWWLRRYSKIDVKIRPVPIFCYRGWWRRLLWDILNTPRAFFDPYGRQPKISSKKLSRLHRAFFRKF